MGRDLGHARRVGPGDPDRPLDRDHERRIERAGGKAESRLTAAHELQINLGEQLGVEQGAVLGARGIVDLEASAEGVEADLGAGEAAARRTASTRSAAASASTIPGAPSTAPCSTPNCWPRSISS